MYMRFRDEVLENKKQKWVCYLSKEPTYLQQIQQMD